MAPTRSSAFIAGLALMLAGSANASGVDSAPAGDMQLPDCNSYASVLAYLSVEVYYAKHPYNNNPSYGQWSVPCDPAYPNKQTGRPFPDGHIVCAPNAVHYGNKGKGQDRFMVCIKKKACSKDSWVNADGANVIAIGDLDLGDVSEPLPIQPISDDQEVEFSAAGFVKSILPVLPKVGENFNPEDLISSAEQADKNFAEYGSYYNHAIDKFETTVGEKHEGAIPEEEPFGKYDEIDTADWEEPKGLFAVDAAELQDFSEGYADESKYFENWNQSAASQTFNSLCGERYVIFSGTDDASDALTDAAIWPPTNFAGTTWHKGFVFETVQWLSLVNKYAAPVNMGAPFNSNFQTIFAGHSLGGGVAQIAATYFKYLHQSVPVQYFTIGGAAAHFASGQWSGWNTIPGHRYVNTLHTCEGANYGTDFFQDPVPVLGLDIPLTSDHTEHNDGAFAPVYMYRDEITGSNPNQCWHIPGWLGSCGLHCLFGNCWCPVVTPPCQTITEVTCNGNSGLFYGGAPGNNYDITEFSLHSSLLYLKNINALYHSAGGW